MLFGRGGGGELGFRVAVRGGGGGGVGGRRAFFISTSALEESYTAIVYLSWRYDIVLKILRGRVCLYLQETDKVARFEAGFPFANSVKMQHLGDSISQIKMVVGICKRF